MSQQTDTDVLILGAGPAGLSLGYELSQRQIPYLILDKGQVVGSTFDLMTDSTTYGPWLNNTLAGSPLPLSRRLTRTTRPEYTKYLQDYAKEHALNVVTGVTVTRVDSFDGFLVRGADGTTFRAPILVNATGQYSKPNLPSYPGERECEIPRVHSAQYRSPESLRQLTGCAQPKVLIVGSGLSAGEIMQELYESGSEVHLSYRERIETWPSPLEEAFLSPWTFLWEQISLRLDLPRPANLKPKLRRGVQLNLLKSHKVWTHPEISRLTKDTVVFLDGAEDKFDAIIYATGYRPALDHLAPLISGPPRVKGLASVDIPNLYFLGLPGSRTFRSEFLRGIRDDAPILADLLAESRAGLSQESEVSKEETVVSQSLKTSKVI